MIDHIPDLLAAGVDSLKIEGRAKSAYYAAIVTGAYRHGIDARRQGSPWTPCGGTRWKKGEPPALLHRILLWPAGGSLPRTPGTSGTGRCWRWSNPAPHRLATALCATSLPKGIPLSWWALACVLWPSRPLSWPMPRGGRRWNPGTLR